MKVVIDTNVLISGAFFSGVPSRILDLCVAGKIKLALSLEILNEYYRVADEISKKYPNEDFKALMAILIENAVVVQPEEIEEPICRDPDDDKFITCAVASKAKVIVSGDKDLKDMEEYGGVEIMSPREFYDRYLEE